MFSNWKETVLPTFALIALAFAVDPTPSNRAKWDAVCMESERNQNYEINVAKNKG